MALNIYNRKNSNGNFAIKKSAPTKEHDFIKYEDFGKELSSKELKWGMWFMINKSNLYKALIGFVIAVDAGFLLFSLYGWGAYILGLPKHQSLERSLSAFVNYSGIHPKYTALPIQVISTQIFLSGENKFDAVSFLYNPNQRMLAEFEYYFVTEGRQSKVAKSFLLPGETRPIVAFGLDQSWSSANIILNNVKWRRISAHEIKDIGADQSYKLNFEAKDFMFLKSLAQEGLNPDAIQFKLTNNSPFNFAAPEFYVVLLSNQNAVAVIPLQFDSFLSLEAKNVDLRSVAPGLDATEVAVYPIINIYDSSAYKSP